MKKSIVCVLFLIVLQVHAQEFHFIPKIGINLANISHSAGNMKAGLNLGVAGELMILDGFAVESGVYYSMQGTKTGVAGIKYTDKIDYLNIPVYAKLYMYDGLHIFIGPQFGFNVREKVTGSVSASDSSITLPLDVIKTFDCSLGFGLGYQFDLGLLVSANYNLGFTNLYKTDVNDKSKNGVLQVNVGWRF